MNLSVACRSVSLSAEVLTTCNCATQQHPRNGCGVFQVSDSLGTTHLSTTDPSKHRLGLAKCSSRQHKARKHHGVQFDLVPPDTPLRMVQRARWSQAVRSCFPRELSSTPTDVLLDGWSCHCFFMMRNVSSWLRVSCPPTSSCYWAPTLKKLSPDAKV